MAAPRGSTVLHAALADRLAGTIGAVEGAAFRWRRPAPRSGWASAALGTLRVLVTGARFAEIAAVTTRIECWSTRLRRRRRRWGAELRRAVLTPGGRWSRRLRAADPARRVRAGRVLNPGRSRGPLMVARTPHTTRRLSTRSGSAAHCGICLPQCPTYRVLGEGMDSPRGASARSCGARAGRVDETFQRRIDLCLGCRACGAACPSGVVGSFLEATRAQLRQSGPQRSIGSWKRSCSRCPEPARLAPPSGVQALSGRALVRASVRICQDSPPGAARRRPRGDADAEMVPARGRSVGHVGPHRLFSAISPEREPRYRPVAPPPVSTS
jgi:NAD-dependent dihydropyrimidine dehydrogenase PreA subunit